jgi:hypothetical protein
LDGGGRRERDRGQGDLETAESAGAERADWDLERKRRLTACEEARNSSVPLAMRGASGGNGTAGASGAGLEKRGGRRTAGFSTAKPNCRVSRALDLEPTWTTSGRCGRNGEIEGGVYTRTGEPVAGAGSMTTRFA